MLPDGGHAAARQRPERRSSSTRSSTRWTRRPGTRSRSGSSSWPLAVKGNDQNLNNVLGNLPHVRRRRHRPAAGARRPAHRGGEPGPQRRHGVRRARPQPVGAAQPDHHRRDHVRHHGRQQQRDRRHLPRLPDLPERDQGDDGAAAELRAWTPTRWSRSSSRWPSNLGPTLRDVARLSPSLRSFFTNLGPLITVSKTGLPAIRDVLNGTTPLLGLAGPVPRAAQPDPDLAVAAPAADQRLHLQRRRRPGRQDDQLRRRRHRPLPAPVPADRPRDAVAQPHRDAAEPRQHLPAAAVAGRSARASRPAASSRAASPCPNWDCNNTGAPGDGSTAARLGPDLAAAPGHAGLLGRAAARPADRADTASSRTSRRRTYSNK